MVEGLHHRPSSHRGSAYRGTDPRQRRKCPSSSLTTSNALNRHVMYRFCLLTIAQLNLKPICVAFNAPLGFSALRGSLSNSTAALSHTQSARLFDYCLCSFASIRVFVELCVGRVAGLCVCIHYLCS